MKQLFAFLIGFLLITSQAYSQGGIQPYSFSQYQRINRDLYTPLTRLHTSIKPILPDDIYSCSALDSVSNRLIDTTKKSWVYWKLFNEHLVQIEKEDFNVYIDILPDFQIGRDGANNHTTWLYSRGYQIGGNIGKKFSFYTSGYENQGVFPVYLNEFINKNGIIPGLVNDKFGPGRKVKDWAYATALLNYTVNKHFSFTLGQDKNFIGDGYRSMILSDVATNYPFFKIATTLGNVKYLNIWAQFQDLRSPQTSYENGNRKKWGVFHYLDWNVNNRLSLGFFDAIIWQNSDSTGRRGFDVSYINPIIFLRTVEGLNGSPDNALIGFTGKYKVLRKLNIYGQFVLDEFTAKELFSNSGYWANKYGVQLGVNGYNIFHVSSLNYLLEYNTARPYTYSQRKSILNYGHYNQPLAHPFGANFREVLTIWNYSIKRWNLYAQANIAKYGLDPQSGDYNPNLNLSYGKDIYESYENRIDGRTYGHRTLQGLKTDFLYLDTRLSYLINPKTNLRIELGSAFRKESNVQFNNKTNWITFGLRSSFRNLYQDF
ncbi:MAG: gliding motility protein RemB [Sphingobacteriales bacterium]|nr:gliding motility protein RemB [Sphingobacteriales bacterium]